MNLANSELEFKRFVRARAGRWSSNIEHGLGGDGGFADTVFRSNHGLLLPLEFKIAVLVKKTAIRSRKIRPEQYAWHRELRKDGGVSRFVFGVYVPETDSWRTFWSTIDRIDRVDLLFHIGVDVFEAEPFEVIFNVE